MNRLLLFLALSVPSGFALAQDVPPPSTTGNPAWTPAPVPATISTTSSRISRVVAGPNGRTQGLLLRNGMFVNLSPGLSQRFPTNLRRNAIVHVSGAAYGRGSERTILAQQLSIAGITYNDAGIVGVGPAETPMPLNGVPTPPAPGALPPPLPPAPGTPGAVPPPPGGPIPPPPGTAVLPGAAKPPSPLTQPTPQPPANAPVPPQPPQQ